ncbi:MAG: DRTGG domain-containing protein, partial [Candidatus Thermoplasmatota archaeon]|nr:DRTGG domain-containing protein [Candidatus Thermoplasmatota archaeon]
EIRHIFVGAMSANAAMRLPNFKEEGKLIITSGDRSDMILAALDSKTACIVLTNNVLPPGNILAEAQEKGVPILSVPFNTFETSKKIDEMETMITKEENAKIVLLEKLVKENIDLQAIF